MVKEAHSLGRNGPLFGWPCFFRAMLLTVLVVEKEHTHGQAAPRATGLLGRTIGLSLAIGSAFSLLR